MNVSNTISIVIANYNAGMMLHACVASALASSPVDEVIVVDNHSSDTSLSELALRIKSDRLKIILNSRNLGFSTACNIGASSAAADLILFLNPDTAVIEGSIESMLAFMQSNPHVGMCGPLILNEDGSEQRGCRRDEPTPIAALKTLIGSREKGINKVGAPLPEKPIEVDAISGACMMVRREALEDVGPMDEGYFLHCEDLDWCKRFWLKGWKVMFLPNVSITHVKGGSSRKRPVRVEWHKHKGMVRYYHKFYRDQYPKPLMYLVYSAIWARFFALAPVWMVKGWLR